MLSRKCEAWSVESELGIVGCEVGSAKCEVWSVECKVQNVKCRVERGLESKVWRVNREWGLLNVMYEV